NGALLVGAPQRQSKMKVAAASRLLSLRLFLGHFSRGGLGNQVRRLADPIVLLDAAAELQHFIDVGDVVVGKVGDLLKLYAVELAQAADEIGVDALDLREIIGLALLLLEALPLGIQATGARV